MQIHTHIPRQFFKKLLKKQRLKKLSQRKKILCTEKQRLKATDFLSKTMQDRMQWDHIFKSQSLKICQSGILY